MKLCTWSKSHDLIYNALAYYNAGVAAVNLKVVGFAPGWEPLFLEISVIRYNIFGYRE
jgi:hypothetical protein